MAKKKELVVIKLDGEKFAKKIDPAQLSSKALNELKKAFKASDVYSPNIITTTVDRMMDYSQVELAEYQTYEIARPIDKASAFCCVFGFDSVNHPNVVKLIQEVATFPADTKITQEWVEDYLYHLQLTYNDAYYEYRKSNIYDRFSAAVSAVGLVKFLRFAQAVMIG